ncbi:aspartyl/asparaginyl beta-hydroxylase domain-containing protein [Lysobacter korlensis]|uniref:Aspartyl/asparaginyl beta-hydroxylase domain-containing protein n=1 Tax=Lysobacter korlensis TaxID=553636 RepID=A0ABV6S3P3_9GAMM
MSQIRALADAASAAVNQGRWGDAERLWRQVVSLDPKHPRALYSLGVHAFKRGELVEARRLLQDAHEAAPGDPVVLLSLSVVLREQGDSAGELRAIDAALAADPYFLSGLLAKADYLERHGRGKAAALVYGNALKVAPPEPHWPAALRAQLQHGRELKQRYGHELAQFLADRTGARLSALTPIEAQRWREAGAIIAGQSQPYHSQCNQLHVPRLPAIPFFEREAFDWVEALEAKTEAITAELHAALSSQHDAFRPYVAYAPGSPVNQWHELNHSTRWSSYFLWENGQPITEHLQKCPQTAQALADVDMADIGGLCPNAMFSALAPRTRIPPHQGETNARVIVHLPLVVPDHCLYRVGFEERRWKVGEVLVFDDSIEHEARNDSDELRVVLIFDVWNPLLSAGEREMVRALSAATREFQALR